MKSIKVRAGMISLALLLLAVPAMAAAGEEMYRWVDANGEVHYSDQPPPPEITDYKSITRSGAAADTSYEGQFETENRAEKEAEFQRRRAQELEEEAKAEQVTAERKRNCELARGQYNTISAGGRISRRDASGEVVYLDDEQIAAETEEARAEVEKWCDN
jgi:hypothetical protein